MHQLHVGDKVLIVSATGDITTSFVVHPDPQICHYVLEDLSKCNPFIMGIKGMSSKKLLGRSYNSDWALCDEYLTYYLMAKGYPWSSVYDTSMLDLSSL